MDNDVRTTLDLMSDWYLSTSPADARLAAELDGEVPVERLDLADDPENHPVKSELPGDRRAGLRPLAGSLPPRNGAGERLPNPFVTYARKLTIPAAWSDRTLFLCLNNARYSVTLTIDGHEAAHYVGGLEPRRFDVTKLLTPGKSAIISITVGDAGTSGHRPFDVYNYTGTRLPTCDEIRDNLTHPVVYGGVERTIGEVTLEALPRVRVESLFIDPKVSLGELHARLVLVNDGDEPVQACVQSEIVDEHHLVLDDVMIPAGGRVVINTIDPWPDAILWDVDNPHLYELETVLLVGRDLVDRRHDTFGVREFTINGPHFYLNGKKIHLFGQSGHTQPDEDRKIPLEEKIAILRLWKEEGNVNHIRLHAKPQDKGWVEAADRVGMLITTETAMWTTNFHSFDFVGSEEACYRNIRDHFFHALVERDRNNPSVIIWSLTNEMSPITRFDLEIPKMAAMTRILERILEEAREVDSSRVIQMSSAMDFLGRLVVYNLHYPKNWQAFPDYPHTAYWLEEGFLFPWYGPRRFELPPWSWRRDKPLIFGEFTCVYGATPDNQAAIVGDIAFERQDFGSPLVHEKLWPMEMRAYRRQDVSGFTAWACMYFHNLEGAKRRLQAPDAVAHTRALRPLAVLDHSYRTRYFSGDTVAVDLSMHNDTRSARELALVTEARLGDELLSHEVWPPAIYGPAEGNAFTSRFRIPANAASGEIVFSVHLSCDGETVDTWIKRFSVTATPEPLTVASDSVIYDPIGLLEERFRGRGLTGFSFNSGSDTTRSMLISFAGAMVRVDEWDAIVEDLIDLVEEGGCVILDQPPAWALEALPTKLQRTPGYAPNGELEITYAYNCAPHHPIMQGLTDADFALWGKDYYVARGCYEIPQQGNVRPLLLAGTDRGGLTSSPLLEIPCVNGSWIVSRLEILPKLLEEPNAARLLARICSYRPAQGMMALSAAVGEPVRKRLAEVGCKLSAMDCRDAIQGRVVLIDGEQLLPDCLDELFEALHRGTTICLHALSVAQTTVLLKRLELPGDVTPGTAASGEWDTFTHTHPLADGMSNNYLYWIVDKAKVAMWTKAPLHPQPATALIKLPPRCQQAWSLTRRGAITVYTIGKGCLVIDNLNWQESLDEPERARRYLATMLTNLGVDLDEGSDCQASDDYETDAERRERGHF